MKYVENILTKTRLKHFEMMDTTAARKTVMSKEKKH